MDFALNEEQSRWQNEARHFAKEVLLPASLKRDQIDIDVRLAGNNLLPSFDFSAETNRDFGSAILRVGIGHHRRPLPNDAR